MLNMSTTKAGQENEHGSIDRRAARPDHSFRLAWSTLERCGVNTGSVTTYVTTTPTKFRVQGRGQDIPPDPVTGRD